LDDVVTEGDAAATFVLKRSQPAFLFLLAGGMAPVYPCHVPPQQMRLHPIGTGPFKFVEFKPNEHIRLAKNPDYWKPGRPYLDGIEWTVVPNRAMQTPPAGLWGLPPEILQTLPGYAPDVEKSRAEGRKLMEKHGYGPNNRIAVKVQTRNIAQYRDPAIILIDQLKQIYIDGELDVVETANWFPKIARKDFTIAGNLTGSGVDDPDAYFYEHYACGSERNYTNYCNPELEKMYERQSIEADQEKRKKLVWEIDRRLQEDAARPMVYHYRLGTCWYPRVHGITVMVNSIFNGWRFEEAWLDK